MCKFTPLGFETFARGLLQCFVYGVNLPRWGLKLAVEVKLWKKIKV